MRCITLLLLALPSLFPLRVVAQEIVLLGDRVTLNAPVSAPSSLQQVNFRRSYPAPPLVFVLPDSSNPDPSALRVTNITTSGFDVSLFESPGEDGRYSANQFSYLAISPGTYNLGGGDRLEAGTVPVTSFQSRLIAGDSWQTLVFSTSFPAAPALLLQLQGSANGSLVQGVTPSPWLTTVSRNVSGSSAEVALERSETSNGTVAPAETVAYLAMTGTANGSFGGPGGVVQFEALRSADSVTGWDNGCSLVPFADSYTTPLVLADKSTRDGSDGGWLRQCSLSSGSVGLRVDEDRSEDTDRSHTDEIVSVMVFSRAFNANLPGGRGWEADTVTMSAYSGAQLSFTSVSFAEPFESVPLVFTQPVETGSNPASVRIRSVSTSGFQAAAVEPTGSPGAHESMTIDYYAVLPGQHQFEDGTEFEAGFIDTTTVQRASVVGGSQGWETVNFNHSYSLAPALLAQLQTTSNSDPGADPSLPFVPWLTVAVEGLSAASVQLALERSEAAAGSVLAPERLAYLAIAADRHGSLSDIFNVPLEYDTRLFGAGVRGYDDGCFSVSFTAGFPAVPLALAHGTTRNGNNGGWVRRCALSPSAISAHVDEDVAADPERAHISESVAVVAFERPFRWRPFPDLILDTSLLSVSDGIGNALPKAIPGAVLEYQVTVSNAGRGSSDTDSIVITDAVPAGTELFVGDLDGAGNPVVFADGAGADASGLVFDASTDLSFSNDGGSSFGYLPAVGDWDASVTNLRVNPRGVFAAGSSGSAPMFTLRYRVRVL